MDAPETRPLNIETMSVRKLRSTRAGRDTMKALGIQSVETGRRARVRYDKPKPGKSAVGPFIGWDGEGITRNQRHRYVLLANSEGASLYNARGLNTVKTLDWLCDIARDHKEANHVMFGGSYDANMLMEGLGFYQASELASRGVLYVSKFRIEYRPRKFLRITRYRPGSRPLRENQTGSITLWDTIGFFQTTFVKALRGWLPGQVEITDTIAGMKDRRSTFSDSEIDEIRDYCIAECRLLAELMSTMRDYMQEVECVPHRWDGAGAIASILLQRHKVKTYKATYRITTDGFDGNLPQEVNTAARHAYFGGRIELVRFGNHDGTAYAHDIVSAYPHAMTRLPCLAHGTWRNATAPMQAHPIALYHVSFHADSVDEPFYPLPWRSDKGLVYFPPTCEGWYWTPEYELLRDFYPDNHTVHEAWTFTPDCTHEPFSFIAPVFEYRKRLKEQGHMGATVLKLGLNSLYGKLAQQVGWRRTREGIFPPSYHCLEWAGLITSTTRARLFRLAMRDPEAVIAFETDGLYSTAQHVPDSECGTELGDWERTTYDGLTYVQSGVYWTCKDGAWVPKYRGLDPPDPADPDAFTRDRVLTGWANGETELPIRQTRFRGIMTSTVSQERFMEWRQWVTDTRSIELAPNGKRVHSPNDCPRCLAGSLDVRSALHHTMATGGGVMSCPHGLAWSGVGVKTLEYDEYYRAAMALDEADEDG